MILLLWWIVGVKLWAARLVIILFSLASIPMLYLVGKKLTDNESLILTACLFFTVMPISIFFGRNVQPEAPAVFLILLGTYLFLCWRDDVLAAIYTYKRFFYFSLSFLLVILLKVPNGIGLVPLLFFVPYKQLFSQKKYLCILAGLFIIIMALFPLWVKLSQVVMPGAATVGTSGFGESFAEVRTNISLALSSSYWSDHYLGIRSFVLDNFTGWFFWLTLLGVIFSFLKLRITPLDKPEKKGLKSKKKNKHFIIPEHGVNPWRSRRCNRGCWSAQGISRSLPKRITMGGRLQASRRSESQKT